MEDPGGEENTVYTALSELHQGFEAILTAAKPQLEGDIMEDSLGCLNGAIELYITHLEKLKITKREEAEDVVKNHPSSARIQDAYSKLVGVETEWDNIVTEADTKLYAKLDPVKSLVVGGPGPMKAPLLDARTGEASCLQDHLDEKSSLLVVLIRHLFCPICKQHINTLLENQNLIDEAGGKILLLTFAEREKAVQFLKNTQFDFPMLVDEDRKINESMGLSNFISKTWCIAALSTPFFYLQYGIFDKLPSNYEIKEYGIKDTLMQMGGNLFLDRKGIVSHVYISKTPFDRPSIEVVQDILQKTKKGVRTASSCNIF